MSELSHISPLLDLAPAKHRIGSCLVVESNHLFIADFKEKLGISILNRPLVTATMPSEEELLQCAKLRSEEWTVLSVSLVAYQEPWTAQSDGLTKSVYPEYTSLSEIPQADQTQPVTIRLEIPVELEGYQLQIDCETLSQAEQRVLLSLTHLPSLVLTLLLPSTYPLRTTPLTMYLHVSNGWLTAPDIQKITQSLRNVWEEELSAGVGSLWRTCEWIRNGSFLFDIGRSVSSRLIRYVTL